MRLFDIMEMLLAAAVGIYMFFRVRRLLRFYGVKEKKIGAAVSLLAAAGLGASCLDLWTTRAMVVLHFVGLFLVTDFIALLVQRVRRIFAARKAGGAREAEGAQEAGEVQEAEGAQEAGGARESERVQEAGGPRESERVQEDGGLRESERVQDAEGAQGFCGRDGASGESRGYAFWRKLSGCGLIPVLAVAMIFLYGYFNMNQIQQTYYLVETDKQVGNYRILLMTDIHYGTIQDPDILGDKLEEIRELHPDMVVLGGDIVEEGTSKEKMQEVFQVLGGIESKYGVFYIYGNHDRQPYTTDRTYTDEELEQAIEAAGIQIIRDEYIEIGEDLILAGREDAIIARYLTYRITPEEILQGVSRDKYIIMVDHEPVEAEENAAQGVDLMLCGHTHAGQIWPVGLLNELTGTMNYGEYQRGGCKVIVSSGVAGWGYTIRTAEHCEYVVVDIVGRVHER